MYRWHKDRVRTLRQHRIFVDREWNNTWNDQIGRFRKNKGLGCPIGRHCNYCSRVGKTPQERRSDFDFDEQVKEHDMLNT